MRDFDDEDLFQEFALRVTFWAQNLKDDVDLPQAYEHYAEIDLDPCQTASASTIFHQA